MTENRDATADVLLHCDGSFIAPETGPAQEIVSAPFSLTGGHSR